MIDLQVLQRVMDERGYLVIASMSPLKLGEILQEENHHGIPGPFVVHSETTMADMDPQAKALAPTEERGDWPYYYRVLAE